MVYQYLLDMMVDLPVPSDNSGILAEFEKNQPLDNGF